MPRVWVGERGSRILGRERAHPLGRLKWIAECWVPPFGVRLRDLTLPPRLGGHDVKRASLRG